MIRLLHSRLARSAPQHVRRSWKSNASIRFHSNNIHDKYADKLKAKAEHHGITIEELLKRAQPDTEKVRQSDVADLRKQAQSFHKKAEQFEKSTDSAEKTDATAASEIPKSKPVTMELSSFIDVSKFAQHSAKEIELLWKARFLNSNNAFSGAMNVDAFSKLYVNARKYPTFVLPLPHEAHGIELHYVQWSFVTSQTIYCLITPLAQYKLYNEYAHPHTTFMLHTDFAADKQIVLTNAVVQDNEISTENAALLVLNLQRFYTADAGTELGKAKIDLLRQFNTGDASFSVDKLIDATETLD